MRTSRISDSQIMAILKQADNDFLVYTLPAAEKVGDKVLPEDVEKLVGWAKRIKSLGVTLSNQKIS